MTAKTILPIDWQTLIAMPEWAAQMDAPVRMCDSRVEVLNPDGVVIADINPDGGTVQHSEDGSEQWVGELKMVDLYPVDDSDLLHPLALNKVRIWWQEWLPELGGWGEVPLMTGIPEDPDGTLDPGLSWSLHLRDTITEAKRARYGGQILNMSGMTVTAALTELFDAIAPRVDLTVPDTDITLPAVYLLGDNDPADDWDKIAKLAGWVVYTDRMGSVVVGPQVEPSDMLADWREGDNCRVTKISRGVKTSTICNAWMAKSTSAAVVPPIVGYARDDDEGSSTWVGRYGPYWGDPIESDAIATQEAADNVAAAALAENLRPVDTTSIEATARPDIEGRALINLGSERLGVAGGYRVATWQIDLPGAGRKPQDMSITMTTKAA